MSEGVAGASEPLGTLLGVSLPPDLVALALTHRSYANEQGGLPNNERLEFLGDAVLEMVITDALYREYPDRSEGDLAKIRASVVSARSCAEAARAIGLGQRLLLGRGELATNGRDKTSILADAMEALLGAVYLGCGLDAAKNVVMALFGPAMRAAADLGAGLDWKTSLQELTARNGLGVPEYVCSAQGPDHDKIFRARVKLPGGLYGNGLGRTKKDAEMQAAQTAYAELTGGSAEPPGA